MKLEDIKMNDKDICGNLIEIGTFIAYASRNSCDAIMNVGIVYKFYDSGRIGVISLRQLFFNTDNWTDSYDVRNTNLSEKVKILTKKVSITNNATLVISQNTIPEKERQMLIDILKEFMDR